jgi:hypothetical protein
MVAAEGVEPTSLDYRSSALPLSYTAIWSAPASTALWIWGEDESARKPIQSGVAAALCRRTPKWLTRRGSNPHLTD